MPDQIYVMNLPIPPLTLPVATGGNGALSYSLSAAGAPVADGASVLGLTYNAAARTLTGTATAGTLSFTWFASDSDPNTATADTDTLTFSITVEAESRPYFAVGIPDQTYLVGQTITPLTLPVATGGNGAITYQLYTLPTYTPVTDGVSFLGLTYNAADRTLTGTPTTEAFQLTLQWSAIDSDNDNTYPPPSFNIRVVAAGRDIAPTFGGAGIYNPDFDFGETVALTLPVATGGNGALSYSLYADGAQVADGASVFGLTYNAAARTLTGTATSGTFSVTGRVASGTLSLEWNAIDSDDDTATLTFSIRVRSDIAPVFGMATAPDQSYIMGTAIPPLTLPEAYNGNGALTYALTPAIAGLTFDPATRILTGTPTTVQATTTYDYRVVDGDGNNTMADADLQMFTVTVAAAGTDIAPTFGVVVMPDQIYVMNLPIPPLTLPVATGGNGALSYSLSAAGAPVADGASVPRPDLQCRRPHPHWHGDCRYAFLTWFASDSDPNTATADTDTLTFSITVEAESRPYFATSSPIPDQTYLVGQTITPLTLPVATGGNGAITYQLYTLPTYTPVTDGVSFLGLTYNAADRTLTGTPTTEAFQLTLQWSAHDADSDSTYPPPTFNIRVVAAGRDIAPTFGGSGIGDRYFDFGETVALTLPVATGGNGALSYSLYADGAQVADGASVLGLTYNAAARTLTGTAIAGTLSFRWLASDSDADHPDSDNIDFNIRVSPDIAPVFDMATVPDQSYIMGETVDLTLPPATGGNGLLRYTLTDLPAGLTYDEATRTITGAPTTAQAATTYDYGVVDGDGNNTMADADLQMFTITVVVAGTDIAPTFGGAATPDQLYFVNLPITPLTLPVATGGNGALNYSLSAAGAQVADGASVLGLTYNAAARTLTGTAIAGTLSFTWFASDSDPNTATDDTATLTFSITVEAAIFPAFAASIPRLTYIVGQMITPLTLPVVTGGNVVPNYSLSTAGAQVADGASVLGLTYNAAARTLTGTPTTSAVLNLQWSASNSDHGYTTSRGFRITVVAEGTDIAPDFGGSGIGDRYFDFGQTVALTLPVATGGNGALTYSLSAAGVQVADGASVLGLTYNAAARTLTGTAIAGTLSFRWLASDSDADHPDSDNIDFNIRVSPTSPRSSTWRPSPTSPTSRHGDSAADPAGSHRRQRRAHLCPDLQQHTHRLDL